MLAVTAKGLHIPNALHVANEKLASPKKRYAFFVPQTLQKLYF